MNGLDWFLLLLLAGGVIRGYQKGLILQAFSLVGSIFALLAAYRLSGDFSQVLMERFPLPEEVGGGWIGLLPIEGILYRMLAFILLFAGVKILISIIARLLTGLFDIPVLSQINRLGGVLLNLVQVFLILFIGVHVMNFLPWETGREAIQESFVCQGVLKLTPDLSEQIGDWLKKETG
ncbi:putative membrane protein required for colicin V production [Planifilum fimeticola]|jgi:membrane protein required for colicin V production|uniref:Putative membrane protein required for colicin V production n=1 Tax=Planifilum fimeticola TaxID=201975 RepID=A0A2T0LIT6_9BACL|nr:CvpA family protein [Planifilum fimeticola]PRX42312.1 putative membrane protein required for colicin V production [Planifilum fimeticola]